MAPHTKYYAVSDLRDAIAMPLTEKLESGGHVKYVQPTAFINDDFDDGKNYAFNQCADMIEYAKNMATAVKFVDERTAKKIKININSLIREGKAVDPEAFAWAGLCDANLIELWHTVNEIKMMALGMCADNAEFETYANYTEKIKGEGYVMISRFGYFKLVNRREFSYHNFINPKFAASAL